MPSVELHGNLSQNARTRNLDAFHGGKASTLVATDIAARGIHVDDVALVVHADPPVEHKAYLHRSGRTARAGAAGTVITLMTDEQVRDVRTLTRQAGIKPITTKVPGAGHPILVELAPGERSLVPGGYAPARVARPTGQVRRRAAAAAHRNRRGGGRRPLRRLAASGGRPPQAGGRSSGQGGSPQGAAARARAAPASSAASRGRPDRRAADSAATDAGSGSRRVGRSCGPAATAAPRASARTAADQRPARPGLDLIG